MTMIDGAAQSLRTVPAVSLDVVLGPMKSGKSLSLISMLSPLQFTRVRHRVYQSERHVRDTGVTSRSGGQLVTTKVATLHEALAEPLDVVAVDEVHMFDAGDVAVIGQLLARGTRVVVAGIDLDHRGELFATVRALLELGPDTVSYRRAVCDQCRDFSATHTQVLRSGEPFLEHLGGSEALPDDGTFSYEARCRSCFVRPAR
ncbi:thymidine kinase [Terrabacter terrae]|uniref:Thymidine kinase n=2 Tax=Terrabacter terrae TaxID=318434 RepID=A0ABP5FJV5_9MICO